MNVGLRVRASGVLELGVARKRSCQLADEVLSHLLLNERGKLSLNKRVHRPANLPPLKLINVYCTTFKALIHEEFGDGIMSAIDFKMDLQRAPNAAGDRINFVMSSKLLPCKTY